MKSDFALFWSSYALSDWLISIVILIFGFFVRTIDIAPEFKAFVYNGEIMPSYGEIISFSWICFIIFVIGLTFVFWFWLIHHYDSKCFHAASAYLFAISITILITNILGKLIGRPKPNTSFLCPPNGTFDQCKGVLTSKSILYQFKSFPCEFSALSMASGMFISLLIGNLWKTTSLFKAIIRIIPIFSSLFIGITRLWDHQSHIEDVLAGFVIGGFISHITWTTFKLNLKDYKIKSYPATTETSSLPMARYN